jgi:hypothetical protein
MHANPATVSAAKGPDADGWVDVSQHAALHGFSGPVSMTHAAWMDAVYFVDDLGDRLDPVRENWRLGRALEEVSRAVENRVRHGAMDEFTLSLREGFDRLRSLSLPSAHLRVRVDRDHGLPEVWVDVSREPGQETAAGVKQRREH